MKIKNLTNLQEVKEKGLAKIKPNRPKIAVGMSTCGAGSGGTEVFSEFEKQLKKQKLDALLVKTGCFGYCAAEPMVNIFLPSNPMIILSQVKPADVKNIVKAILENDISGLKPLCKIEEWDHLTEKVFYGQGFEETPLWDEIDFFKGQVKYVLRNCGLINPLDIEEYIGVGGYEALYKALRELGPEESLKEIKESGLRGRGGAGFPVWLKWHLIRENKVEPKYIICNADEGDPGAYMNRNELEGDPHMIIEGMIIGGYISGAKEGIIYCRAEYPLAVEHLNYAIESARSRGLLGKNIFGSGFDFDISLIEGAGAFVCGAETALISSIEGNPGWPTPRPPYPSEEGLYGKPTCINNVETWANIPIIIKNGGFKFAEAGTEKSPGTKVFSLVGKIKNTGLVELPLGTPIKKLVYDIGGGSGTNKKIKAVQTGGPSGGCIPAKEFDTPIDYESLSDVGSIMGSGGVVVMDEDNCMVDVAHYFTEFTTSESCGKCVPCREGMNQILDMLAKIKSGQGEMILLEKLEKLSDVIRDTALCGLGQTGPNPAMTTIRYFMDEYEEHIKEGYCDAGVCEELFSAPCENSCPLLMNIPAYLELFLSGRLEDAFEEIIRYNPLPSTIGRICHFHCKTRCLREDIDAPVAQGEVHRFIADRIYEEGLLDSFAERIKKRSLKKTGKKVAIIGSGPAGLTAGFYLSLVGHGVTVYDKKPEVGGILRWGIPAYRLPREVLKREVDFIEKIGVKFRLGWDVSSRDLKEFKKEYDALIIATGAYTSNSLNIPGEDASGVISGSSYLERVAAGEKIQIGKNVLVVGGGNVAIDAARTLLREDCSVTVLYRRSRDQMPANLTEIEDAEAEKVKFIFWRAPSEILADESGHIKAIKVKITEPGDFDLSGRRSPQDTGTEETIECDTLISAIGESVDKEFLIESGFELNKWGNVEADKFTLKSREKVFSAGDVVTGPGTAVQAMAQGKRAAAAVDRELGGHWSLNEVFREIKYDNKVPLTAAEEGPAKIKKLGVKERVNSFSEISMGLTESQAITECRRCLRCDVKETSEI